MRVSWEGCEVQSARNWTHSSCLELLGRQVDGRSVVVETAEALRKMRIGARSSNELAMAKGDAS